MVALCAAAVRAEEAGPFWPVQSDRWALGAQITVIPQWHPGFHAAYTGANSLRPEAEIATSTTGTLALGVVPWTGALVVLAPEMGAGEGLSGVVGAGAFPNADIVRVPSLPPAPYIARAFVSQTLLLRAGSEPPQVADDEGRFTPGPGRLGGPAPDSLRVELAAGKFGINDVFDLSDASNDPHHRFLNWALVNQGAWDYCADVRGYTWAAVGGIASRAFALRAGMCLMPTQANGPELETDLSRANALNVEATVRWVGGSISLLGYRNKSFAGSYREALDRGGTPDLAATRAVRAKRGTSLKVEQELGAVQAFARLGWNDGHTETFAYSEIDRSLSAGATVAGRPWGRPRDALGIAGELGGLSREHADFLAAGGRGFLLGDGALRYAPEIVLEAFYAAALLRGIWASVDAQLLVHPGFNADRGPVPVVAARLHLHL